MRLVRANGGTELSLIGLVADRNAINNTDWWHGQPNKAYCTRYLVLLVGVWLMMDRSEPAWFGLMLK